MRPTVFESSFGLTIRKVENTNNPDLDQLQTNFLQFRDVTTARFLSCRERRTHLHSVMCDFFLGKWSGGREKPYK